MKALVKAKAEPGLWLQEVPDPAVGPMDVLIKIRKTSICGTDVHIWKWDAWAQRTIPLGMHVGHEFCGVVEAVGAGVTEVQPGELMKMPDATAWIVHPSKDKIKMRIPPMDGAGKVPDWWK